MSFCGDSRNDIHFLTASWATATERKRKRLSNQRGRSIRLGFLQITFEIFIPRFDNFTQRSGKILNKNYQIEVLACQMCCSNKGLK